VLGAYLFGPVVMLALFTATVLVGLVVRMRAGPDGFVRDASATAFVTTYTGLLGGFAVLVARGPHGPFDTLIYVGVTVASDLGGYAAGVFAGRHPMAPSISPKKSWEGFGGSVLACLATGWLMVWLGTSYPWWTGLILGAAVVLTATTGDLMESLIKRDLGIKDMGTLLPGHGGIMDRLDSLLPSAFICWLFFILVR
jgi:phosphatidate cytidylyltransferase